MSDKFEQDAEKLLDLLDFSEVNDSQERISSKKRKICQLLTTIHNGITETVVLNVTIKEREGMHNQIHSLNSQIKALEETYRKLEERTKFLMKSGPIVICRSLIEGQIAKMVNDWKNSTACFQEYLKQEGWSGDALSVPKLLDQLDLCGDESEKTNVYRYIQYCNSNNKNEYVLGILATLIPDEHIIDRLGTLHASKDGVKNEIRFLYSTLSKAVHKAGNVLEDNKVELPLPIFPLDEAKCLAIATILLFWKIECIPYNLQRPDTDLVILPSYYRLYDH